MTQFFPFSPSVSAAFQFQPQLDGAVYNATVPWSLFGARYYLNLSAIDGTQIWYGAIVGSPTGVQIQALSWANGIVTVTTADPHGYKIATTVALTLTGCAPDAYNGQVEAFITGATTFSFMLAADPGPATGFGATSFNVNLIGGVPNEVGTAFASTLVFRQQSQTFEVSP